MNDLVENAEWRGKFFAGDVASRSEFDALTKLVAEADTRSEKVIDGTAAPQIFELTTRDQPLSTRDLMTAASGLEEVGITRNSSLFRSAIEGGGVSEKEYKSMLIARDRLISNAGWSKALLAGNKSAAADLAIVNIKPPTKPKNQRKRQNEHAS